jgi:Maltogenic Amylase, C-terminal domain
VYAFMRTQGKESVVVVYNFAPAAVSAVLTLPAALSGYRLTPLLTAPNAAFTVNVNRVTLSLPVFGYAVYKIE